MNILLSIVIPVYNVEKYIERCLESIGELSKGVEVILINDGSTDNSEKICEKYSQKQGYIYINKKNEGCSTTRNLGIALAKGKYIWFIDSDDYIEVNDLQKILLLLEKEKMDILVLGLKIVDNAGNVLLLEKVNNNLTKEDIYMNERLVSGVCNKIYKLDIIKKEKIKFPIRTHLGEDMAFNLKTMIFAQNIKGMSQEFYIYYRHGESVTNNFFKRKEIFISFDDIITFHKKNFYFDKLERLLKDYYRIHCIKYTYKTILESTENKIVKKRELDIIKKEITKRKKYFKSNFLIFRYKILFNYYRKKLKKYFKECEEK